MKTLYIADLDGTLLDADAALDPYSRDTLNRLIAKGLHFTVATARTAATVRYILSELDMPLPAVTMNGVCLYDLRTRKDVRTRYFGESAAMGLCKNVKKYGNKGFLYTVTDGEISTAYVNLNTPNAESFVRERESRYGKKFTRLADFAAADLAHAVYYSVSDRRDALEPLYRELRTLPGLRTEYYRDIYNEDFYYLEVCEAGASKYEAVMYLRRLYGFERVIAFGDNLNDLPLFEAADEAYAVSNAKDEVKTAASGVVEANTEHGVARAIERMTALST